MKAWFGYVGFIILGLLFIVFFSLFGYDMYKTIELDFENQEKAEGCEFLPGCERTKCLVDIWNSEFTKMDHSICLLEQIAKMEIKE